MILTKRRKPFFRVISLMLIAVLMMTGMSVAALEAKVEAISTEQTELELWQPEVDETLGPKPGDLTLDELAERVLPEADRPEVVSEMAIEENEHVNRLWEQEEDLNTVIFQNRDGTKTMYYYAYPVKYIDEDGTVCDKRSGVTDMTDKAAQKFVAVKDTAKFIEDYAYTNADNDVRTYFPKALSKSKGVLLEHKNIRVEMSPVAAEGREIVKAPAEDASLKEAPEATEPSGRVAAATDTTTTEASAETTDESGGLLPGNERPLLSVEARPAAVSKTQDIDEETAPKDTLNYDGVFGNGTTLRYTPLFRGFKEDIVLERYTGIHEFTFRIRTHGLSLTHGDEGYSLVDPLTGETKASIGELIVYDSRDEAAADKKDYNHYYAVQTVQADQEYLITIVVDEAYLRNPDTVWPVTVDPPLTLRPSTSANDIHDAPVYSGSAKRNTPSGSNPYQHIGKVTSSVADWGTGRLLVKFPNLMTKLSNVGVTSASQITVATYSMRLESGYGGPANIGAYYYPGAVWTESTIKCSQVSWSVGSHVSTTPANASSGYIPFDILAAVKNWKACPGTYDPNRGLVFTNNSSESSTVYDRSFYSKEYGNAAYEPKLEITYNTTTAVSQVCLTPADDMTINVGTLFSKTVSILPSTATNKSHYISPSSSNIVQICKNGDTYTFKGLKTGEQTFTVYSSYDSSKKASFTVTVGRFGGIDYNTIAGTLYIVARPFDGPLTDYGHGWLMFVSRDGNEVFSAGTFGDNLPRSGLHVNRELFEMWDSETGQNNSTWNQAMCYFGREITVGQKFFLYDIINRGASWTYYENCCYWAVNTWNEVTDFRDANNLLWPFPTDMSNSIIYMGGVSGDTLHFPRFKETSQTVPDGLLSGKNNNKFVYWNSNNSY